MQSKTLKFIYCLLALLISASAWTFVVYNYYPMTDIKYSEVPVSFTGAEELAQRGLVVSESSPESISVTLNQERVKTGKLKAEDIKVTADVSKCSAGANTVGLSVAGPQDTFVSDYDTDTVEVNVVRATSKEMDIDVLYEEGAPNDVEPIAFNMGLARAEAICANDQVKDIKHIAALIKYDEGRDTARSYTCKLYALDEKGEVMQHVIIQPDEISLDARPGFTKEVNLEVPVKDRNRDGYERKYTVPDKVTIKGSKEALSKIDTVEAEQINLEFRYENENIPIEYKLPEDVYLATESHGQVLKLTVNDKAQNNASSNGN